MQRLDWMICDSEDLRGLEPGATVTNSQLNITEPIPDGLHITACNITAMDGFIGEAAVGPGIGSATLNYIDMRGLGAAVAVEPGDIVVDVRRLYGKLATVDCEHGMVAGSHSGELSFDEMVVACRNIGFDLTCGRCASVFYTGMAFEPHCDTCATGAS